VERTENSGRERILSRIRSALTAPAHRHTSVVATVPVFAPVSVPLHRFQKECAENITECIVTSDVPASADALRQVLESIASGEIYIQDAPVLRRMAPKAVQGCLIRWSTEGPPPEASQATVTLAESLVAATGSLLVASSAGGRAASVVAPVHIVVASQSQLEPDLDTALAHANQRGLAAQNSCLCLITGSSRTADIEKILVLGAHGPRRLVVILAQHLD
jgi:L-lactate dehydrogenase complex protein LldG